MADEGYILEQRTAERITRATRRVERISHFEESADYGDALVDGNVTVTVKITGAAAGNGKYNGRSLSGTSTAVATGTLAMPEGMTVAAADDVLFLHLGENGGSGHDLAVDGTEFVVGVVVGQTADGKLIVQGRAGSGGGGSVPAGTHFAVTLATSSGSAGTDTVACDFKYTATDLNGNVLDTELVPRWAARGSAGAMTAATEGAGYYGLDDAFVLAIAFETPGVAPKNCLT